MSNRSNDIGSVINAEIKTFIREGEKNENRFGAIIHKVMKDCIEVRLAGEIAPWFEWTQETARIDAVANAVIAICGYDKESMPEKKKNNVFTKAYLDWVEMRQKTTENLKRAVRAVGAIYVLNDRAMVAHEEKKRAGEPVPASPLLAEFVDGQWRIPLQWFAGECDVMISAKSQYPDGRGGFTFRNNRHAISANNTDGKAVVLKIKITPEDLMKEAGIGTKRTARPSANSGAQDTTSPSDAPRATVPLEAARNAVAMSAGIDDFKYRPTKAEAESWETMFDTLATNVYFRAMMVAAISRANKAEGEAASEAQKRSA